MGKEICFLLLLVYTVSGKSVDNEAEAKKYIEEVEVEYSKECNTQMTTRWNYITNITDESSKASTKADTEFLNYQSKKQAEIMQRFPNWKDIKDPQVRRAFRYMVIQGPGTMPKEDVAKMNELSSSMESAYSKATVCEYKNKQKCDLRLDPEIEGKLHSGTDYDELAHYWTEWHNTMGKAVTPHDFQKFVDYQTKMAKANGLADMSELWLAPYDDGSPGWTSHKFKKLMLDIWGQLKPYYSKMHAFVRMKLRKVPEYQDKIKKYGGLPIHLMGNMWGQDWSALDAKTKPYPAAPSLDATEAMVKKGYTPLKMFQVADEFFQGLGLLPMTKTFWEKSLFSRPSDRDVVCHASAEDFCLGKGNTDFRIKECTKVKMEDLVTVHHEMGHIQYFMQYTDQLVIFRTGANPGFHEAIGDALALAVTTPSHLQCVLELDLGLDVDCGKDKKGKKDHTVSETDLNYLYITALQKLASLPFGISLEQWRWEVFEGKLKPEEFNKRYWDLKVEHQGLFPPSDRHNSSYFDPAGKYHTVASVPYIRYFVARILQFQFYDAMCKAAGEFDPKDPNTKPLYQCDFSGSKAAGKSLEKMMKLGFSKPWPEALKAITGSDQMSIEPMLNYFKPLFEYMDKELKAANEAACFGGDCEERAKEYLANDYEKTINQLENAAGLATWNYNTDLKNPAKEKADEEGQLQLAKYKKEVWKNETSQYEIELFKEGPTKRLLIFVNDVGIAALEEHEVEAFNKLTSKMTKIYGTAKVCPYHKQTCNLETEGLPLNPDLEKILTESSDYDELAYVWKSWRDVSGKNMRETYKEYLNLGTKAAEANGYKSMKDIWLLRYERPGAFPQDMEALWVDVKPLYEELHAYVRFKLSKIYPKMNPKEAIPAHLLGNMWSQAWDEIFDKVAPYPDAPQINITNVLLQKFTPDKEGITKLFDVANQFFLSLGLSDMSMSYGEKGMIVKPKDREVVCHASAWDFSDGEDFRIKMCTNVNMADFITVHHELGHIQYYINYKHQPNPFRTGANPGFHEAIGDVVSLSVGTAKHMKKIGYLDPNDDASGEEATINFLMQQALRKVAFLPFGYLIDSYRWKYFDGVFSQDKFTYEWIKMRNEFQGIVPPVKRSEHDFDPGCKYHVAGNVPYIRYFVSFLLQFQVHKALCIEAGEYPKHPLHDCDIYESAAAGAKFKKILEAGASKNWQELLEEVTGSRNLDPSAIKEYFSPLVKYMKGLREKEGYHLGWSNTDFEKYYE